MMADTTTLYLLLISIAALMAAVGVALARMQKQIRRFERFWNSPTGMMLVSRTHTQATSRPCSDRHLERRVSELQDAVKTLASKQEVVTRPADGNLPIENAVRMARHGASIDDLVRNCGLNIGEARLMQKLHSRAQAKRPARQSEIRL